MKQSLSDILKRNSKEYTRFNTLKERIEVLDLSDSRVKELKNEKIKSVDKELIKSDVYRNEIKTINTDEIVGLFDRPCDRVQNWLELLESLHKRRNFELYDGRNSFESFLINCEEYDLPIVIKINNEYYISGNGKHRLTIAKCLGNIKAKVLIETVI
ncbi:TPA: hypothetical protein ACY4SO_000446 [Clostridium perfringens]